MFFWPPAKKSKPFMFTQFTQFCNIRGKAFSIEIDPKYHVVEPDHGVRPIPLKVPQPFLTVFEYKQTFMMHPFKKHS